MSKICWPNEALSYRTKPFGSGAGGTDAPICQDDRLGGLDVCLARSIVCHDPLVDLAGEEAFEAPDDIAFGPAASSPSCDVVDGRLVESHADDDGSIEGGVGLSVATPIEAVPAGGHPGRGRDGTRAAELREGGVRTNPVGVVPEDDQQLRRGVGAHTAAELLIIFGDNPDRIRSEAAFAKLCGACPIPASSGMTTGRHRLNRGGHRHANAALYRAVIVRMQFHQPTRDYVARRIAAGRTKRDIIRCLKRFLAREIYQRVMTDFRARQEIIQAA